MTVIVVVAKSVPKMSRECLMVRHFVFLSFFLAVRGGWCVILLSGKLISHKDRKESMDPDMRKGEMGYATCLFLIFKQDR